MSKILSGSELRERLLGRLVSARAPSPEAWVHALGASGNRELLGLIALRHPRSIGELSEFAGRAQPNVSRSLAALVNAGLVEVKPQGRVSVPALTALGRDKAGDIGLLEQSSMQLATESPEQSYKVDMPFLSVSFDEATSSNDVIMGSLIATVLLRGYDEPMVAKMLGDLNVTVLGILDHWWRMLYRRDAPYKIGEFGLASGS